MVPTLDQKAKHLKIFGLKIFRGWVFFLYVGNLYTIAISSSIIAFIKSNYEIGYNHNENWGKPETGNKQATKP